MPQNYKKTIWLIIILLCVWPTFAKDKQKRIALVIGNSSYNGFSNLKNPGTDAADMTAALTDLGFEVVQGLNQNKQQIEGLINNFINKLAKTKGIGLVFYSGIGVQSNGENFIVPIDASFASQEEKVRTSVSFSGLLSKLKAAKNKINLVLLDSSGFGSAKISLPANTIVFYSAEAGQTALKRCGRNGYFAGSILKQLEKPKLEFRDLAKNVSEDVSKRTNDQQRPFIDGKLKEKIYLVDKKHRLNLKGSDQLAGLFEDFKAVSKCICGYREESISVGKTIIEKYGNDELNKEVVEFVKKKIQAIENEDTVCLRNANYNNNFKAKKWPDFFAAAKEVMKAEGDSPLALDVMLDVISVGFDRAAVDKMNTYDDQTLNYAKTALQRINASQISKTGKWGVFVPFNTKEGAKSWMNFIIGWEMYYKLNQKREALPYFYKSTQISSEKKNDVSIYTNIGNYYFDEYQRLYNEYLEKLKASNAKETDETKWILGLARGNADRAIDALGRAYKILTADTKAKPDAKNAIAKTLSDLYKFRFNLEEVNQEDVDKYTASLITGPMPDPTTRVELILQ